MLMALNFSSAAATSCSDTCACECARVCVRMRASACVGKRDRERESPHKTLTHKLVLTLVPARLALMAASELRVYRFTSSG